MNKIKSMLFSFSLILYTQHFYGSVKKNTILNSVVAPKVSTLDMKQQPVSITPNSMVDIPFKSAPDYSLTMPSAVKTVSSNLPAKKVESVSLPTVKAAPIELEKTNKAEEKIPEFAISDTLEKNSVQPVEQERQDTILYQPKDVVGDEKAMIAFNFQEADLSSLLNYIQATHGVTFIPDDIIIGSKDAKGLTGHKISFRTHHNLTREESWHLFISFMHFAGFDVVPMTQEGFYRIVQLPKAAFEPIPTYIGVDHDILPDSDMVVRYIYFCRNLDPAKVAEMLKIMKSPSGRIDLYTDLKALIFTDRANSIKSLMNIVMELDKAIMPEVLSVIKLKKANVDDVKTLYDSLKPSSAGQPVKAWAPTKRDASAEHFPSDIVMVGDKRTNSLILLGTAKDVARVEDFIIKYIDISLDKQAPPIFTYQLQYTNASDILKVLDKVVQYGSTTAAGAYGGVRDGIRYFSKIGFASDPTTNSIIINASVDDYKLLEPLIKELDVPQKQVGLEVLIVQVKDVDTKVLGAQISGPNGLGATDPNASPYGPTFGQGLSAQTSGIPQGSSIVTANTQPTGLLNDFSIKTSLASLLGSSLVNEAGSILVTFGRPIWALFKVLKTITSIHIVDNPFLVVSNGSTANIISGEERRLVSGIVTVAGSSGGSQRATGFTPIQATLELNITPYINKGNIVNLDISVKKEQFTQTLTEETTSINNGSGGSPKYTKSVKTRVSVANGETLVLGGIMVENYATTSTGVPFLENIPVFGWFFKSKARKVNRDHFLIFICPRLLDPLNDDNQIDPYTDYKLKEVQQHIDLIDQSDWFASKDPIQRAFFGSNNNGALQELKIKDHFTKMQAMDGKIDEEVAEVKDEKTKKKKVKPRRNRSKHDLALAPKTVAPKAVERVPVVVPVGKQNKIMDSVQIVGQGVS